MVDAITTITTIFFPHQEKVDHDVFISYSRKDKDFVKVLRDELKKLNKDTWVDWSRIPASAQWWEDIENAIEAANTFVFVISPASIESEYCRKEIEHAVKHNKRLVPILHRDFVAQPDANPLHPEISAHQWIFFREGDDFERAFKTLVKVLETDLEHVRTHTRLLVRAIEWEKKGYDSSFLLRGSDLKNAEQWLRQAEVKPTQAKPLHTPLQKKYIDASRKVETRHQTGALSAVTFGFIVAIALGLVAFTQYQAAEAGRQQAIQQRNLAEQLRQKAEQQMKIAQQRQIVCPNPGKNRP